MKTIKGVLFPLLIQRARRWCLPIVAVAFGFALASPTQAQSVPTVVETIAALRALNATSFTNDKVVLVIDYYAPAGTYGRGGGHFRWLTPPPSGAVDDGGHFIASTGNTNGIWERMLQGESANVKMWGAVGDGSAEDFISISNAIYTCEVIWNVTELVFPRGNYLVTNTLVFNGQLLHLRGESPRSTVQAPAGATYDIFRTYNAQQALTGGTIDYDHRLRVDDLSLTYLGTDSTANRTNACLVVCQPGEVNAIHNLQTERGGYGVKCLGYGGPNLRIRDCTFDGAAIAGISFEPLPGVSYGGGDPVSLTGVSGDMRNQYVAANACLILFSNVVYGGHISEIKAEGDFGGGVIKYVYPPVSYAGAGDQVDLVVENGNYNAGVCDDGSWFPPNFLTESGGVGAPVTLCGLDLYGVTYLINDLANGRQVECDTDIYTGSAQQVGHLPINYQSQTSQEFGTNSNSRLVVGQTAFSYLYATNTGWYRVMMPITIGVDHIAGKLVVSQIGGESDEMQVDVYPYGGAAGAWLNVTRCSSYSGSPVITEARAYYYSLGGGNYYSCVDIYVGNPLTYNPTYPKLCRLTLAMDINGLEQFDYHTIELVGQPYPVSATIPAGAVTTGSVNVFR